MRFGVLVFPGSNCDHDCYHAAKHVFGQDADFIWHKEESFKEKYDGIIIPGGFSYGDYLRCGAIARFSPVMKALDGFAKDGGLVIGICNGFQILLEAGLLPGAMLRNESLKFICKDVNLKVENTDTPFTNKCEKGQVLRIPIAHAEGNYFADDATLADIEANGQVVFRYCEGDGSITDASNPNGASHNIAGICNKERNVLGMMPHPERAVEAILGNEDGRVVFESILASLIKA